MGLGKRIRWCPHGCGKSVYNQYVTRRLCDCYFECERCNARWANLSELEREKEKII